MAGPASAAWQGRNSQVMAMVSKWLRHGGGHIVAHRVSVARYFGDGKKGSIGFKTSRLAGFKRLRKHQGLRLLLDAGDWPKLFLFQVSWSPR